MGRPTSVRYESLWHRICAQVEIELGWCECWTWTGHVRRHGGGDRPALTMRVPQAPHPRQFNVARLVCEMIQGPPPTPLHEASHLCPGNWLCVNPDHLVWETHKENMARMRAHRMEEWMLDNWDTPGIGIKSIDPPF